MSLTCKVRILLDELPEGVAGSLAGALGPDNIDFPEGLNLSMNRKDRSLLLEFECSGTLSKLISTIDEVLEHAQISLEVVR